MSQNEEVFKGFDRDIDYDDQKTKFIDYYNTLDEKISTIEKEKSREMKLRKLIYLLICMNQLRNGSRISESCLHFKKICENRGNFDKIYVVKISKSESIKYKDGKQYTTKARFRNMKFMDWVDFSKYKDDIVRIFKTLPFDRMKKRCLDFMLIEFDKCNTHSLRYAKINDLLNKNVQLPVISKFVGHVNQNMLTKYTQNKNVLKVFDIE